MQSRTKLRVAVVGSGYFSHFHYDAWQRIADVELVGACSPADNVAALAKRYGIDQVYRSLDDMLLTQSPDLPDVIDLVTPPPSHVDLVTKALAAGCSVICQKPFCRNLDEARTLVALADKARGTLVVHENFRFQPWHQAIKRVIDDGRLGDIYQVTFTLRPGDGQGPDAYLQRQPYFQTMERFLVHETAIHQIDVMRYLLGEPDHVYADLRRLNPHIKGEDAGLIVLGYNDGRRGVFDGNRLVDHAAENTRLTMGCMLVEGEHATLTLRGDGGVALRVKGSLVEQPLVFDWRDRGFGGDCVYRLNRHVVRHLRDGAPLQNSARDYLRNLKLEQAVYESAQQHRRIEVDSSLAP